MLEDIVQRLTKLNFYHEFQMGKPNELRNQHSRIQYSITTYFSVDDLLFESLVNISFVPLFSSFLRHHIYYNGYFDTEFRWTGFLSY